MTIGLSRRELIVLSGAAVTWSRAAWAQRHEGIKRVGVLVPYAENDAEAKQEVTAFLESFQQLGWTDGQNVRMDYRWAGGEISRIQTLAKELVALQPDAIVVRSTPTTAALLQETRTIPIVFVVVSDPVGEGFVASIARPGGNVTGFTNVEASMGGKWLELLKEVVPRAEQVAVMFNPKVAPGGGSYYSRLVEGAAPSMGVKLTAAPIQNGAEIEHVVERLGQVPNGALLVLPDVATIAHRELLFAATLKHRVPAVYGFRHLAVEGGLASYGVDLADLYRRAAPYVDRILRGEKPGELPVQAPVKFVLTINLKTAKALGLTVPPTLLARADEVIE